MKGEFPALFELVKDDSGGFSTRIGKHLHKDVDILMSFVAIVWELGPMWIEMNEPGFNREEWCYQV